MSNIHINKNKLTKEVVEKLKSICPFNAFEGNENNLSINSGCKVCKLCVKKGPMGVCEFIEETTVKIDKSKWVGITVYAEHLNNQIHPVSFELIGKAKELAKKINHPVYAIIIGHNVLAQANELLEYGVDKVFVYDDIKLSHFNIEPYTSVLEDFINNVKPSTILYGSTGLGRSFAPRVAARFKTGLTADCTILDIKENSDLVQIRPAFGGNIMAQIITQNHRPQMATVRYKIFDMPKKQEKMGEIVNCKLNAINLSSNINILSISKQEHVEDISEAEIIVCCGRAFKTKEDLKLAEELADILGAELACTRPIIEAGWMDARRQIGLSGRTVKPKMIFTLGISGAVQFAAGMNSSETIFAINNDPNAQIFDIAHYAIVGDIYEIIPQLIEKIKQQKKNA